MKVTKYLIAAVAVLTVCSARADEGMWLLHVHAFGRVDISGKGIKGQTSVVPRNGNDVFQHNHVAPHGIGTAFLLRAQKILEIVDECEVEFL